MMVAVEEKLAQLGSTVEAESFVLKPMGRGGRRRLFARRMLAAGMAAAVLSGVIGGIVLAAGLGADRPETVAPSGELKIYLDKSYGWQMSYPSNWLAQGIDDCSTADWCERGALVSNLDRDVAAKWGILLTDVPSDFVGVKFGYSTYAHLGEARFEPPDTPFPLSLKSLELAEDEWPRDRYWDFVVVDDRNVFRIDVWIGPDASPAEVDAVETIVASITEPVHAEEQPLGFGEASVEVGDERASVLVTVEPAIVPEGEAPKMMLENTGTIALSHSAEFKIERMSPAGWEHVNVGQVWPQLVLNLSPGQISEEPIAVFEGGLPVVLSPGTYRLTRSFGDGDAQLNVSVAFVVED